MSIAARPRLVIDNSSSTVSSTPRVRAKSSKGKCHLLGIAPFQGQLPTVEGGIENAAAISARPPNRLRMSDTSVMDGTVSNIWMLVNPKSGPAVQTCKPPRHTDNGRMAEQTRRRAIQVDPADAAKELLKRQIGARLKEARLALRYENAEDLASALAENAQNYRRYERGDSFVPPTIMVQLGAFGISINYLVLGIEPKLLRR